MSSTGTNELMSQRATRSRRTSPLVSLETHQRRTRRRLATVPPVDESQEREVEDAQVPIDLGESDNESTVNQSSVATTNASAQANDGEANSNASNADESEGVPEVEGTSDHLVVDQSDDDSISEEDLDLQIRQQQMMYRKYLEEEKRAKREKERKQRFLSKLQELNAKK